jgi:hypothetical protein
VEIDFGKDMPPTVLSTNTWVADSWPFWAAREARDVREEHGNDLPLGMVDIPGRGSDQVSHDPQETLFSWPTPGACPAIAWCQGCQAITMSLLV